MQLKATGGLCAGGPPQKLSKAADALYLTQPTIISAHIQRTGGELGSKLVVRSTKEIQLTATGNILYGYANQILGLCERRRGRSRRPPSDIQGALSIAASTVPLPSTGCPAFCPICASAIPRSFSRCFRGTAARWLQRIFENGAEMGIIGSPVQKAGCVCTPLLSERMVIVTPNTLEFRNWTGPFPDRCCAPVPSWCGSPARVPASAARNSCGH